MYDVELKDEFGTVLYAYHNESDTMNIYAIDDAFEDGWLMAVAEDTAWPYIPYFLTEKAWNEGIRKIEVWFREEDYPEELLHVYDSMYNDEWKNKIKEIEKEWGYPFTNNDPIPEGYDEAIKIGRELALCATWY